MAILSAEAVRNDLDLSKGFFVSEENIRAGDRGVIVGLTIDLEIISTAAFAIHREADTICVGEVFVTRVDNARDQECYLIEATRERKIRHLLRTEGGGCT